MESMYTLAIVNFMDYFYEKGGFKLIFDIIFGKFNSMLQSGGMNNNSTSYTPFYVIQILSQVYAFIKDFVDYTSCFTNELSKFKEYIFARVTNMTEHEIKEVDKQDIEKISYTVKKIYEKKFCGEIIAEELILNYHYKCLTSKVLEKRIKSITHLVKLIEDIKKKDNKLLSEKDENDWLNSTYLFSWFKEKGIIDYLLGENLHEELLKRSLPIFQLYAKKNSLSNTIYDLIWKNILDRHESISIQLQNIICELTLSISDADRDYLFEKVKSFPAEKHNNDYIVFLKNFTLNCLKVAPRGGSISEVNTYGLNMLWNFMQDNNNNLENIECACSCLSEIFKSFDFHENITKIYLSACLDNIKSNRSVIQCIKLLRAMIVQNTSTSLLKEIDTQFSIMDVIVKNFIIYLQNIRLEGNTNNSEIMNSTFAGIYNHKTNLELRFEFIQFLYRFTENKKFKIELNGKQLTSLWDNLILNSRTEGEKNMFYNFLYDDSNSFAERIAEYAFNEILSDRTKFDIKDLNRAGMKLFEKYFININYRYNRIYPVRKYFTQNADIIGITILWEILVESSNESVKREAASMLANLCTNLTNYDEEPRTKIWTEFISKLLHYFQVTTMANNESGIRGILLLIKFVIKNLDWPGNITSQDDVEFYQNAVEYVFIHQEKNLKRPIKISGSERVIEVREKVSFYFDIPINAVCILTNKRLIDLRDDFKIFKDLADPRSVMKIVEKNNPILELKNNPSDLIKENKFIFNSLFDLLNNSNSSYIDDAWELINLLPKSREIEESIFRAGNSEVTGTETIDWNKFLDYNSIFKMSYSLQIIKSFFSNVSWVYNFRKNGGVEHLIQLLMNFKAEHFSQNLGFQAFYDIIDILNNLKEIYGDVNKLSEFSERETQLVNKLFELSLLVMKSSYEKDNDQRLKDLQHEWTKKRNREIIHRQFYMKKDDTEQMDEIDEIHENIRAIWNNENKAISLITSFLWNFNAEVVIQCLLNPNDTVLKEILTFGLICPKNYMIKFVLFSSIEQFLKFRSEEEQMLFYKNVLRVILTKETLNMCISHNESCEAFFKIGLLGTFENYKNIEKAEIDLKEISEYMITYIENYSQSEACENVLVGFLWTLREMVLLNSSVYEYLTTSRDLLDLLMNKCVFTKCQCKLNPNLSKSY
jgi:hypothetical protein